MQPMLQVKIPFETGIPSHMHVQVLGISEAGTLRVSCTLLCCQPYCAYLLEISLLLISYMLILNPA